jgi:hypothetical protein
MLSEFAIIAIICFWFIIWGFIGRWCASVKGINPVGGFLAGLFLGPLALLILLCKPMK